MSNQLLETDPIFDSDVLRMYIWDLIMIYDEYLRGSETTQSDGARMVKNSLIIVIAIVRVTADIFRIRE